MKYLSNYGRYNAVTLYDFGQTVFQSGAHDRSNMAAGFITALYAKVKAPGYYIRGSRKRRRLGDIGRRDGGGGEFMLCCAL